MLSGKTVTVPATKEGQQSIQRDFAKHNTGYNKCYERNNRNTESEKGRGTELRWDGQDRSFREVTLKLRSKG